MAENKPTIIVDDDWKRQAQAEKERLAKEEQARKEAEQAAAAKQALKNSAAPTAAGTSADGDDEHADGPHGRGVPKASFSTLVSSFLTQALLAMGAIRAQGMEGVDLDMAKFNIEMLEVLEQKSAGNLSGDEIRLLNTALHQARMTFVEVASHVGPIGG